MNNASRRAVTAGVLMGAIGCSPAVPLAPPPVANPIAMQVAPGPGFSLQSVESVFLVMNAVDTKNRSILTQVGEVVAAEFRAATPAPVVLLIQNALQCPPADNWAETCRICEVPTSEVNPTSVVVFCDILEYDPYTPLRVGLSFRVRRATDGLQLVALQGTWLGPAPFTPRRPHLWWLRKKGPVRPNVDFTWTADFEALSATQLVRNASHQCVATIASTNGTPPIPPVIPAGAPPKFEELVPPPAPPALPDVQPPPMPDSGQATADPFSSPPPVIESGS